VVRTRTDVALYVLNHKRGHLRDLESAFKITLSVVADATVSGQQSYIIDRGEQVHTLEAAKALLAAQAAAAPSQTEEPYEDEERFDVEAEIETEETEGLTDEASGEDASGEGEADGHRRKRRRRRRGRGGEAREGGAPRDDSEAVRIAPEMAEGAIADEGEAEEDETETDEQPGFARAEQGQNGERRPRRRGRRGGRRRRGGTGAEDGLAGSIADELAPPSASEVVDAVADFDGGSPQPAPSFAEPESVSPTPDLQPEVSAQPEPARAQTAEEAAHEAAQEAERTAAPRRSTVREKVSFFTSGQPEAPAPAPVVQSEPEPASAPAPAEPAAPAATTKAAPRKAGWWSRRFGGGN
jgi:ribonuclease E